MRECPTCGIWCESDRDFCPCGEYLRWEPTGQIPVLNAAAAAPVAVAGAAATPVMSPRVPPKPDVLLTLLDAQGAWMARPALKVAAGGTVRFRARVRNQSAIVDHFGIRVDGTPDDWWTIEPRTHFLMPLGAGDASEGEFTVTFHPPRSPAAEARDWSVQVIAVVRTTASAVTRAPATVTIGAYHDLAITARPPSRRGRWHARYDVDLRNAGNGPVAARIEGRDDSDGCRFRVPPAEMRLGPGAAISRTVTVRPRKPIVIGSAKHRRLELIARPSGDVPAPPPATVAWEQRAWLPSWLVRIVPLVVLAVAALIWLHVRVPDVTGLPIDEAKRRLDAGHLSWEPEQRRSKEKVGTVLETIPPAGAARWRGAKVTVVVATNRRKGTVPRVQQLPYADAVAKLAAAGFRPGGSTPRGDRTRVTGQVPAAGRRWPRGRPVELFFDAPAKAKPAPEAPAGSGPVRLPRVAGLAAGDAADALRRLGFKPSIEREISTRPRDEVLGTRPAKRALPEGATVVLRVSAGYPDVAYEDRHGVYVADGIDGSHARRLKLAGPGDQSQPSWTPDGARLVYRSGSADAGGIWISGSRAGSPTAGHALTGGRLDDRRPAVSPDGKVIAFVRGPRRAAAHRLCLVPIAGGDARCLDDIGAGVSRPAWAPNGNAIVVRTDTGKLVRFVRERSSAASRDSWSRREPLPLDGLGAVREVAWSSRGDLAIALASDPRRPASVVVVDADGLGNARPIPYLGIACELSWRSDGAEILISGRADADGAECPETGDVDGAATRLTPDGGSPADLGRLTDPAFRPVSAR